MRTARLWLPVILSMAGVVPAQQSLQPVTLPVQNPSFEQFNDTLAYADPCGMEERNVSRIAGWKFVVTPGSGGAGGLIQPNGVNVVDVCGPIPPPPDGQTAAFAQNTTISQTLQIPAEPVGVYVLKFWVANYFYWYSGNYTVSLILSSVPDGALCSNSGHPVGEWTQMILTCPVRDHYASTMTLSLASNNNWPMLFDDVQLTFTPEAP